MNRTILILIYSIVLVSCINSCRNDDSDYNNWISVYQNDSLDLVSINFLDEDNGFVIAGLSGIHGYSNWKFVLSTENAGKSWNQVTCTSFDTINLFPLYDIVNIFPISKNVLLSTGYYVHRSYDKGKTWTNVSSQINGAFINDLFIADSLTWIMAKGKNMYRTNNGGVTWQNVFQTDFMGAFGRFSFSSSNIGYINIGVIDLDHAASVGRILKTENGGQTWTFLEPEPWKSNKTYIPYIKTINFINDQDGYMNTFDEQKLYKTIDAGNSWVVVSDKDYSNNLEYFISDKVGYCSDGTSIYSTNNGGKTWEVDYYINNTNSEILNWTFVDTGVGYALTGNHKILKRIP